MSRLELHEMRRQKYLLVDDVVEIVRILYCKCYYYDVMMRLCTTFHQVHWRRVRMEVKLSPDASTCCLQAPRSFECRNLLDVRIDIGYLYRELFRASENYGLSFLEFRVRRLLLDRDLM